MFGKAAASIVVQRVRGMGGALLGVVKAELSGLVADLGASGKRLSRSLLLFGFGFAFAFWTLGLLIYFSIELLALAVPRWGAVGIVFGLFLLIAVVLIALALSRLRGIESPLATVDRRLQSHLSWWQQRVAGDPNAARAASDDDGLGDLDDEEYP